MKKRILVVDKDAVMRELLIRKLENPGFVIDTARTGEEAKKRALAATYDVIISDFHLPDLEGEDLIAALRNAFPKASLIIMSGGVIGNERMFSELGVSSFFTKPLNLDKLRRTVLESISGKSIP